MSEGTVRGLFLVVGAALIGGCSKPDAMTYCRALEARDLARDCKKDTKVEGSNAAVFKVRDGGEGRVLVTSDDDYTRTLNGPVGPGPGWSQRAREGEMYLAANRGGPGKDGVLVVFPPTLDVFDRDGVTRFTLIMDDIAAGKALPKVEPAKEHPTRSPACTKDDDKCGGAGLCAVMPSNPNNCIAGFDADCRKSRNCALAKMCSADTNTGLCVR